MSKDEKYIPMFEREFYHDGRGPELEKVLWDKSGSILIGFEYKNPDENFLRFIKPEKTEAFCRCGEEVHGNISLSNSTKAGIIKIENSKWKKYFDQTHLNNCHHFQIVFYDDIYDLICLNINIGKGNLI